MPKKDSTVSGGPKFGGFYLNYEGKGPQWPENCHGEMTKVFEYPKADKSGGSPWFIACEVHEKDYLESVYPYEEAKKYHHSLGLNPGLYHLIYHYGPRTRHFVTYADSEKEAKEKIISIHACNFDQNFKKDILELKANLVKDGALIVYGS
jgi:hypothetical protein